MPSRTTMTGRRLLATGRAMRSSRFSTQIRSSSLPASVHAASLRAKASSRAARRAAPAPIAPHRRRQVAAHGKCRRGRAAPGRGQPSPRSGASGSRRRPASRGAPPARRASGPAGRLPQRRGSRHPGRACGHGPGSAGELLRPGREHACQGRRQDPAQRRGQHGELRVQASFKHPAAARAAVPSVAA